MRMRGRITLALVLTMVALGASEAQSQAVITNGTVTLGVNAPGNLNYDYNPATGYPYGVSRGIYEATSPGCLCEGWGAAIAGGTWGGNEIGYNLSWSGGVMGTMTDAVSFTSTASTAKSIVTAYVGTDAIMEITHDYKPSTESALYLVDVTIKNLTGGTLGSGTTGIQYRRVMDWDVVPTPFSEYVTMYGNGVTANLINSSNDGFRSPLILSDDGTSYICGGYNDVDFTDVGACDHGALFDFGFAALDPYASVSFKTFYGATVGASAESAMLSALAAVGAEAYSLGQCNPSLNSACDPLTGTPVTFAFGFAGVGGTPISPVPEPGTWLLMVTGLVGLGGVAHRRRRTENAD